MTHQELRTLLTARQWQVYDLIYIHGASKREAARILDVAPSVIQGHLAAIRRRLRKKAA